MPQPIFISALQTISALGSDENEIWTSYLEAAPLFTRMAVGGDPDCEVWVSSLREGDMRALEELGKKRPQYQHLDRTALLAMQTAEKGLAQLESPPQNALVNLGSSRGATGLFEQYHKEFLETAAVSAYASPSTTLGNISAWTAQHLGLDSGGMDLSVTCSTGLHALLNGIAWIRSGMAGQFIAGGVEAALTPFTLAQMKALRLYSESPNSRACESMRFQKRANTMVLGEGAGVVVLEGVRTASTQAELRGWGFASEPLNSLSSISANASCLQRSMRQALGASGLDTVDVLVMHAPGTVKGDLAEKRAIDEVFGPRPPLLTSNKWLVGHTFAASGMLSLEMALLMLKHNRFIENPFFANARHLPGKLQTVMINAVGFGGNAVSIILAKA